MSTIKVNGIRHSSASSDAITLASDGTCIAKITNNLSNRNLIINGASQVSQEIGTTQVSGTGTCADMFKAICTVGGANPGGWLMQVVNDGPDGFEWSQKITMGGSTWTPSSTNTAYFQQNIEAHNVAHLQYGTASAQTVTLSFWVKASLTGEYSVALTNNTGGAAHDNASRNYISSYTISSANTWEKKTATFTGDTSGTWAKTVTTCGMTPVWDLGSGTSYEASTGSWQTGNDFSKNGCINMGDTASSTWQITGVQLELGSTATDFEHRSYADELARCQRYTWKVYADEGNDDILATGMARDTGQSRYVFQHPVEMRANPSITISGSTKAYDGSGWNAFTNSQVVKLYSNKNRFTIYAESSDTNHTVGRACWIQQSGSASTAYFLASAEL